MNHEFRFLSWVGVRRILVNSVTKKVCESGVLVLPDSLMCHSSPYTQMRILVVSFRHVIFDSVLIRLTFKSEGYVILSSTQLIIFYYYHWQIGNMFRSYLNRHR
jgi:hypothetical protein